MKKIILLAAVFAFLRTTGQQSFQPANGFELVHATKQTQELRVQAGTFEQASLSINNEAFIRILDEEGVLMQEKGAPALPYYVAALSVAPQGGQTLVVEGLEYYDLHNVSIAPSKGSLKRNVVPAQIPYTFGNVYQEDAFFPGKLAEMGTPYILRDQRGANVTVYPYQYNPVSKTLRVYTSIKVEVSGNNEPSVNELHRLQAPVAVKEFEEIYNNKFINYNTPNKRYTPVGEEGKMLVLCHDDFETNIQDLVNWKLQKGIETEVVKMSTVGSTSQDVFNYIQNYYNQNNDLSFVLLVGDHGQIPSSNEGQNSYWETKWSDSKYAFLAGSDKYPEVFIGRLSAENANDLATITTRILEYEKTPSNGDWYKGAVGLASNEGAGQGDEGEADWQHMRNIKTKLEGYFYNNVHEFYDGSQGQGDASGNPNANMVQDAVNGGISLFNYCGHGDQNTCLTGYYGSNEINAATNNGMYPFVISVACNNGTFTSGQCISEDWQHAKNNNGPTGAIAACGSSILMAWAPPMATQDEMTDIMVESQQNNIKRTLGGLFYNGQMKMLDKYANGEGPEVMETWVMFGDPSVMMRTDNPTDLTVTHNNVVDASATDFLVNVDLDGAMVCITRNNEIIGKGKVSGGAVTVSFDKAINNGDELLITATGYNKKPYQQTVTVTTSTGIESLAGISGVNMFPNPTNGLTRIEFNAAVAGEASIVIYNAVGQEVERVLQTEVAAGNHNISVDATTYDKGIYIVRFNLNGNDTIKRLVVK